jgi:hypothetical protein
MESELKTNLIIALGNNDVDAVVNVYNQWKESASLDCCNNIYVMNRTFEIIEFVYESKGSKITMESNDVFNFIDAILSKIDEDPNVKEYNKMLFQYNVMCYNNYSFDEKMKWLDNMKTICPSEYLKDIVELKMQLAMSDNRLDIIKQLVTDLKAL